MIAKVTQFTLGFPPSGSQMACSPTGWPIAQRLDRTQVFGFRSAKACSQLLSLHDPGPNPTKH